MADLEEGADVLPVHIVAPALPLGLQHIPEKADDDNRGLRDDNNNLFNDGKTPSCLSG